jgi:hypothetical protein
LAWSLRSQDSKAGSCKVNVKEMDPECTSHSWTRATVRWIVAAENEKGNEQHIAGVGETMQKQI